MQVQHAENQHPRGKIQVFPLGEHDFLLATCIREVKFEVFGGGAGFRLGEHVSAGRNFKFSDGVVVQSVGNMHPRGKI